MTKNEFFSKWLGTFASDIPNKWKNTNMSG